MSIELRDHGTSSPRRRRAIVLWGGGVVVVLLLLTIGAAGGVLWSQRRLGVVGADSASPKGTSASGGHSAHGGFASAPTGEVSGETNAEAVEVVISPEAARRAGIKLVEVHRAAVKPSIAVPGTVVPNAYRETKVNALVGGIVRAVRVELGASLKQGQPLAVVFSNDLADAQTKYLSLRALLVADDQKLDRTRALVEIGAASRQELEEITALRTGRVTEVAAARQRLLLLGLVRDQVDALSNPSQIVSELALLAPADGILTARAVNPGQVIVSGQELFVVTDLSTVWVIGDVYEKDFSTVRVGVPATVSLAADPKGVLRGRVAYIDPRVDPATRTAKVRVEVPNRGGELRLGMFVQVGFEAGEAQIRLVVPRNAVQSIGPRTVVYVATEEEGRFQERAVTLGTAAGDAVEVMSGLKAGERVVSEGSFFLRAEAARARNAS